MGDRVAVLRDGALQQLAAPQELYERPANLFVASFIGSPAMNLYEATVSGPCRSARPLARIAAARASRRPRTTSPGSRRRRGTQARGRDPARAPDRGSRTAQTRARERRSQYGSSSSSRSATSRSSISRPTRGRCATEAACARQTRRTHASGDIAGASAAEGVARVDPRVRIASATVSRSRSTSTASTSSTPRPERKASAKARNGNWQRS